MTLDPTLLELLVCPDDKGPLHYLPDEGDGGVLFNPRLRRVYEVRDGIPVMLVDEARPLDDAEFDRLSASVADTDPGSE